MKSQRGSLPQDSARNDNFRAKRYIAKYTIDPALAHRFSHEVGSIEVRKGADLVVWKPAFFAAKPALILKVGFFALTAMGDPNTSSPTLPPVHYRPMFGAFGGAVAKGPVVVGRQRLLPGWSATPSCAARHTQHASATAESESSVLGSIHAGPLSPWL